MTLTKPTEVQRADWQLTEVEEVMEKHVETCNQFGCLECRDLAENIEHLERLLDEAQKREDLRAAS